MINKHYQNFKVRDYINNEFLIDSLNTEIKDEYTGLAICLLVKN